MKKYFLIILSIFFICKVSYAQAPATYSSSEIFLQLKKLNVLGSVLYFAAHPDDENTRLLTYFSKEKLYRTGYLSLTRGDGGQNLIGDEQGVDLGLIRTQELLAARRIDGAEQFFSRAYDFGFSKSADETLRFWNHDSVLSDAVWIIRNFQPDVIVTRFPGDARAGHGHHWSSALLAKEAFTAAADSSKFTDQFKYGVKPWQAKRIVWNTFNFGGNNTTSPDQLIIDAGGYNALLGKSYGEIASASRSQHKSQGFGVPAQRGQSTEYFSFVDGTALKDSLMQDVVTSWLRVKGGDKIQSLINTLIKDYDESHPEKSISGLANLYKALEALPNGYWRNKKMDEAKQLMIECSGIYAEAVTNEEFTIPGESFTVQFNVIKRLPGNASLKSLTVINKDSALNKALPDNVNVSFSKSFTLQSVSSTQPYWLQYPIIGKGSFDLKDRQQVGKPQNNAALTATYTFSIDGVDLKVDCPVQYKYTDAVKGELFEPFIIEKPININVKPTVILTHVSNSSINNETIQLQIKSNITMANIALSVYFNKAASRILLKDTTVNLEKASIYNFLLKAPQKTDASQAKAFVSVEIKSADTVASFTQDLHAIQYDHIPHISYYSADSISIINDSVITKGTHIGYINGAGDKVAQALQQMGYEVTILKEADINDINLRRFDAVITGVRAYDVNDFLTLKYDVLMRYINNGGNLIVQYNRSSDIGSGLIKVSPYQFGINNTRVTDETAEISFLLPQHAALNYPNKIIQADFNDWIQERSIYQGNSTDTHFEMPLSMHDVNDAASNGSLMIAPYGKGNFVYASLVFFRELPAGVEGAYKLMANLVALPKHE